MQRLARLVALACLACGGSAGSPDPGLPAIPMGRSVHPRAGEITWELHSLSREGALVAVDLEFVNGASRDFRAVSTRVTLHGTDGERRGQDLPLGALRRGGRKRARARVPDVSFRVEEVTLELLYAVP